MTLLATLLPMLAAGTEFTVNVSKAGDGLRVVTIPKLKDFKPETDDAELGALQAALSQPLVFTINNAEDPDAEFASLLTKAAGIRQGTVDRMTAYLDAQREAQQTAAAEAAKKTEAAAKSSAGKKKTGGKAAKAGKPAKSGAPGVALTDVAGAAPEEKAGDTASPEAAQEAAQPAAGDTAQTEAQAAKPTGGIDLFGEA